VQTHTAPLAERGASHTSSSLEPGAFSDLHLRANCRSAAVSRASMRFELPSAQRRELSASRCDYIRRRKSTTSAWADGRDYNGSAAVGGSHDMLIRTSVVPPVEVVQYYALFLLAICCTYSFRFGVRACGRP